MNYAFWKSDIRTHKILLISFPESPPILMRPSSRAAAAELLAAVVASPPFVVFSLSTDLLRMPEY